MAKFEVGKTYYTRAIGMHDLILTIEVISRTEKTVTYKYEGKTRRSKILTNEYGEFIIPDNYSKAPVFRAERYNYLDILCEKYPDNYMDILFEQHPDNYMDILLEKYPCFAKIGCITK